MHLVCIVDVSELDNVIEVYPELFPADIASGYWLHAVVVQGSPHASALNQDQADLR